MERVRFGTLLKQYREAAALSQDVLAERAGLSLDAISALESGRSRSPRLESARRLADAFGLAGNDRTLFLDAARFRELGSPGLESVVSWSAVPHATLRTGTMALPPQQHTTLIGREREVALCTQLLRQNALLTLVGPGGVGKTRLALQVAGEAMAEFADGIVFVPLAPISDPLLVATAITTALGIQERGTRPLTTTLIAVLQCKNMLLLLDNMEQVIEVAPLIAELLAACASLKILVTSRIPLHLSIEQEFTVPPLTVPTVVEAAALQVMALQQVPSVTLFVARAQRTHPGFALSIENAEAVAAICRKLDGLPLALELAAARIKILSPRALLLRLEQSLDMLTGGARDLPERQQTLRKTVAWSHDLLTAAEQALFARLSIFVGGCSLEAVTAICVDGLDLDPFEGIASLVNQSLLYQVDDQDERAVTPRFEMLAMVREFAHDELAARGEVDELRRRYAHYFASLAAEAWGHMSRPEELEWLQRLEGDTENYWVALAWCVAQAEAGDDDATDLGLQFGARLALYWLGRGRAREGQSALLRLLSLPASADYPHARALALAVAGHLAGFAGFFTEAIALLEEALPLSRAIGDTGTTAAALWLLGMSRTDPVQRRAELEEALSLIRDWASLVYLGSHYLSMGELDQARALVEEARTLAMAKGDRFGASAALDVLGHIARAEGENEAARRLFEQSLAQRRALGSNHADAHILRYLGEIAEEQGAIEQARAYYVEALVAMRDGWDVNRILTLLRGVAALALMEGQPARALQLAGAVARARDTASRAIWLDIAPEQGLWGRTSWEQIRTAAQVLLGPAGAASAWAAGQFLTLDQVIADALSSAATPTLLRGNALL